MNATYKPDFKSNIIGCLEKYGDINEALKWFNRAEQELSDREFFNLVDATIESKYRSEQRFSHIFSLRDQNRISTHGFEDIETLLESYRFDEAEELYLKNKVYLNEAEYKRLKKGYSAKQRIENLKKNIVAKFQMNDQDALSLASVVVQNRALCNNLTWERLKAFIISNINKITFPRRIYLSILGEISDEIKRGVAGFDENTLFSLLKRVLDFPNKSGTEYKNVWIVLCAHSSMLKKFSISHKNHLDSLADKYPFENLARLAHFYLPPEISCLNYLQNDRVLLDDESFDQLQSLFKRNRYFNCETVLALLKAKGERRKMRLKDILNDLLKKIVTRAFNYNLALKAPIVNLIFPRCVSDYQNKNFKVSDSALVFCEGRRLTRKENEEKYMLCRNQQCNEMTELLNDKDKPGNDCYFYRLLKKEFGISSDDISLNKDFIHAMGAFNRWNEIAERLICGYGATSGCGSPLTFSKSPQVKPGRAAYATTYWRCSNPSCQNIEKAIKLSHCGGCGKIIDSRFDKISCKRLDGKGFFICTDCGYCCDKHKVSGICPECGQNKGWVNLDQYSKRYGCLACGHEIAVPGLNKGCLDSDGNHNDPKTIGDCDLTERKEEVSSHDEVSFDDIPF